MWKQLFVGATALAFSAPALAACSWTPGVSHPLGFINCLADEVNRMAAWLACDGDVGPHGHCYSFFGDSAGYHDAQNICREWGGHLAVVGSGEENDFLLGYPQPFWIGHTDAHQEGVWVGVNGEINVWDEDSTVRFWNIGEPNDAGGEDCGQINGGGWNDLPCDFAQPFVCERDF